MTIEESNEIKRIIEKYIPLGDEGFICHVGICSMKRCVRCQDAIKIRDLILTIELEANRP